MIGDAFLVAGCHDAIAFLESEHDAIDGLLQIAHLHLITATAYSQQRGFVNDVRKVGSDHSRRARGNNLQIGVWGKFDSAGMDLENRFAACKIGKRFSRSMPAESNF